MEHNGRIGINDYVYTAHLMFYNIYNYETDQSHNYILKNGMIDF